MIARKYPRSKIEEILQKTGRGSIRRLKFPAHVAVYYLIALGLYLGVSHGEVLRCLLEGLKWIGWDVVRLRPEMLCLADRFYFGYELWKQAHGTGAALLWSLRKHLVLPCLQRLADGSYLRKIYPSPQARARDRDGILARVIEYRLEGGEKAEPLCRSMTNVLEADQAPAQELAALYPERWEIEGALGELKTHLRGRVVLRSKKPALVRQEVYGLLPAHFALRG